MLGRWLPGIAVGGMPRRRTVAAVTARWSLGRWLAAQVLKAAAFSLASSSPETVQPGRARNASTYSPMKPASRTSTSRSRYGSWSCFSSCFAARSFLPAIGEQRAGRHLAGVVGAARLLGGVGQRDAVDRPERDEIGRAEVGRNDDLAVTPAGGDWRTTAPARRPGWGHRRVPAPRQSRKGDGQRTRDPFAHAPS